MLSYLDCLQIAFVLFAGLLVGIIAGLIKLNNSYDFYHLRRMTYHVTMAGMMFYEIGVSKLNKDTWITLGHALIMQIILHVISLLYAAVYRNNKKFGERFIEVATTFCEKEFFIYGYPIAQVLFSSSDIAHCAITLFLQFLVVVPFHHILAILLIPDCVAKYNARGPTLDRSARKELELQEFSDSVEAKEAQEKKEEQKEAKAEEAAKKENVEKQAEAKATAENPNSESTKPQEQEDNVDNTPANDAEVPNNDGETSSSSEDDIDKEKSKKLTARKIILFKFICSINVCAILGIIWSSIKVDMILFMTSFLGTLEKCIVACMFYANGLLIFHHPFHGLNVIDFITFIIMHVIVEPFIAVGICKALNMDKTVIKYLAMIYASPNSGWGHQFSINIGLGTSMISYSLYWTNLICVPVLLIWTLINNHLSILN